jgi:hypothetical protein
MRTPTIIRAYGVRYVRADLVPSSVRHLTLTFRFPAVKDAEAFWPAVGQLPGESHVVTRGAVATVVCAPDLQAQVTQLATQHGGTPADLNTGRTG